MAFFFCCLLCSFISLNLMCARSAKFFSCILFIFFLFVRWWFSSFFFPLYFPSCVSFSCSVFFSFVFMSIIFLPHLNVYWSTGHKIQKKSIRVSLSLKEFLLLSHSLSLSCIWVCTHVYVSSIPSLANYHSLKFIVVGFLGGLSIFFLLLLSLALSGSFFSFIAAHVHTNINSKKQKFFFLFSLYRKEPIWLRRKVLQYLDIFCPFSLFSPRMKNR